MITSIIPTSCRLCRNRESAFFLGDIWVIPVLKILLKMDFSVEAHFNLSQAIVYAPVGKHLCIHLVTVRHPQLALLVFFFSIKSIHSEFRLVYQHA